MSSRGIEVFISSFTKILLPGIKVTIPLTILSFTMAFLISIVVSFIRYSNVKVLNQICKFYVWVIRGTPLLVQLYIFFYGLPSLGIVIDAFPCAVFVLGLNEGAYMAESMRGALEAVPKGQMEAGYCVGMTYLQTMMRIILPQALRTAFPSLSNSFISLIKESSMASVITVTEMLRQAQIINGRVFMPLVLYCEAGLVYLLFCTVITIIQGKIEKKLGAYGGVK